MPIALQEEIGKAYSSLARSPQVAEPISLRSSSPVSPISTSPNTTSQLQSNPLGHSYQASGSHSHQIQSFLQFGSTLQPPTTSWNVNSLANQSQQNQIQNQPQNQPF